MRITTEVKLILVTMGVKSVNRPNNSVVNNVTKQVTQQYVPDKNGGNVSRVDESVVANEVKRNEDTGKIKQKEGISKASVNPTSDGVSKKKSVETKEVSIKNRFDVLGQENVDEGTDIWKEVKVKVDVACDIGIPLS